MFKLKDTLFIYFFYMDDKVSTKFDMTITRLQPTTWGIVAYIDTYIQVLIFERSLSKNRRVKSVLKEKKIIELKKSHSSEIKGCSNEMDHTSE